MGRIERVVGNKFKAVESWTGGNYANKWATKLLIYSPYCTPPPMDWNTSRNIYFTSFFLVLALFSQSR